MSASSHSKPSIPAALWLIRHGESLGNIARARAESQGSPIIEVQMRDVDVPLTALGEQQSAELGKRLFQERPPEERPTLILSSPYARARKTAEIALQALEESGESCGIQVDERLREREFGLFERLTKTGVAEKFPEQAALRAALGKFYYRPPGGESWCDVILRLRSMVDTFKRDYAGERILVVAHHAVIYCFRYLIEELSEEEILAIDREYELAHCSLTAYEFAPDPKSGRPQPRLRHFNALKF